MISFVLPRLSAAAMQHDIDRESACKLCHRENMLMQSGMPDTLWSALLFEVCICMFAVSGQPDGYSNLMSWFF